MDFDYYTAVLYKQFCKVKGINCNIEQIILGEIEPSLYDEFILWIRSPLLYDYYEFLKSLNYHNMNQAIEVNKGRYDSLSAFEQMETVSPFNYTMDRPNSRIRIVDGIVFIDYGNILFIPEEKKVFVTHNPYDLSVLRWPMIKRKEEHDISIGFYGFKSDANYENVGKLAKRIISNMDGDCHFDYEFDRDKYFISINSQNKRLTKLKTKNMNNENGLQK